MQRLCRTVPTVRFMDLEIFVTGVPASDAFLRPFIHATRFPDFRFSMVRVRPAKIEREALRL